MLSTCGSSHWQLVIHPADGRLVLHVYIVHRLGIGAHHGSGLSHDIAHDALAGLPTVLLVPSCTGCLVLIVLVAHSGAARSRLGSCSSRHPSFGSALRPASMSWSPTPPLSAWRWAGLGAFGQPGCRGGQRTDAKLQGELLFDHAKAGVLAGLDEDDDFRIDDAAETAAVQAELASWLRDALHMKQPAASRLAQRSPPRRPDTCTYGRGIRTPRRIQTLCDVLASSSVGMRPGDALALASGC